MRHRRRYAVPLRKIYDQLNAQFWDGTLPPAQTGGNIIYGQKAPVWIRRIGLRLCPRTLAFMVPASMMKRGGYCKGYFTVSAIGPPEIRILGWFGKNGDAEERKVLLHEMAHYAVFLKGFPDEEVNRHGEPFIAELERLAAQGETWAREQAEYYRNHPEQISGPAVREES